MKNFLHRHSDHLGILSSIICLIHCMVGPVAVGATTHFHEHSHAHAHGSHLMWDFVFLGFGLVAVWFSSRHTHEWWMKAWLWVSFSLLGTVLLLGKDSELLVILAYTSSAGLVAGHIARLVRQLYLQRQAHS